MSDSNVQYVICNLRSYHRPSRDKRVAESGRLRAGWPWPWPPRDKLTSANHRAPPTPGPGPAGSLSRECVSRAAGSREEPEANEAGDQAVPNRTGIATAKWYHDTITLYVVYHGSTHDANTRSPSNCTNVCALLLPKAPHCATPRPPCRGPSPRHAETPRSRCTVITRLLHPQQLPPSPVNRSETCSSRGLMPCRTRDASTQNGQIAPSNKVKVNASGCRIQCPTPGCKCNNVLFDPVQRLGEKNALRD
jgi:hypothetical protein